MLEIELKVRVEKPDLVHAKLSAFMTFVGPVEKNDEYWSVPIVADGIPAGGFRLRIREESKKFTVTFKEKTYQRDMEVNREVEFGVFDSDSFRSFLEKMSAKLQYRKRKIGYLWKDSKGVIAELVNVEGLGDYLEVEILYEENENIDVIKLKTELMTIVETCGFTAKDLEPRPYSQLLGMSRY
jgi:predicted adenylyl cyclase CyaB